MMKPDPRAREYLVSLPGFRVDRRSQRLSPPAEDWAEVMATLAGVTLAANSAKDSGSRLAAEAAVPPADKRTSAAAAQMALRRPCTPLMAPPYGLLSGS